MLEAKHRPGTVLSLWLHYFDPHAQYVPHEGAPDFADPARPPGWNMRALYDGEVWFTDQAVGRLLDYVHAQPWGKDRDCRAPSDHWRGVGRARHALRHGFELWEPLMRVPLILYVPGEAPHHVPVKRSHIDFVPTLLDLMRVRRRAGELSGLSDDRRPPPRQRPVRGARRLHGHAGRAVHAHCAARSSTGRRRA